MQLRMLVVGAILGGCLGAAVHAQSWKELANKAKQKADKATGPNASLATEPSPSSTTLSGPSQPLSAYEGAGAKYYAFCFDTDNNKVAAYYSDIFIVTDGLRGFSKSDLQGAFGIYVQTKFDGPKNNGVCFPRQYTTLEQAKKGKQENQAMISRRLQAKGPFVETGWFPEGLSAASPTFAPTSVPASSSGGGWLDASPSTDPSPYETTGPLLYTYCFSGAAVTGQNLKYFLSDIFQIHGPDPGMTTAQYRNKLFPHYVEPFRNYVDIKLGTPIRYQTNFGCEDGFTTRELAQQHKTKYHHAPAANERFSISETGWTPAGNPVTSRDLAPNTRRSLDLQRAIENERVNFAPSCKNNVFLAGNLDCECYAAHMSQARLQQSNNDLAGNGVQVKPLLRELLPTAHLEDCTSTEKIEAYARKQIASMSASQSQKDSLSSCEPSKLASQVMADPTALWQLSVYDGMKMRIMMSCQAR